MWKMIAPPKRDNMFDFPGIPFVLALNQHLSSVFFWWFGAYTLLARLREGLRKPTRPARGAYAITSQLPGAHLRGQTLSSSVEVHCGCSSWKIATFQASAVLAAPALDQKCSTSENPTQGSGCKKRSTHPKCLESLRECLRGAYAEPTRRLQTNPCPSTCIVKHKASDNT